MKLFITDLDGTLLDLDDHASEINMQALQSLKANGYEIVIASGRQYETIQTMGFDSLKPYVISQNGSVVYAPSGDLLYHRPLQAAQAIEISTYCEDNSMLYIVYTANKMYIKFPKDVIHQLYELAKETAKNEVELVDIMEMFYEMYASLPTFDDNMKDAIMTGSEIAYKIEVCAKNHDVFKPLEAHFKDMYNVTSSWSTNREITALHVNKGTAMDALCKQLNLSLQDCVTIGDNQNDIEMLTMSGYAIAMGNASDEIKDLCDYVTVPCIEHGVSTAITHLLANGVPIKQ